MSRICVKNLSKNTNEKNLKEVFSAKGEVTDVRIVRSKSGKTRQFAFIGFRSPSQAQEALQYFNNSFIDNSRVSIEPAKKIGDVSLDQIKSRFTKAKLLKDLRQKEKLNSLRLPVQVTDETKNTTARTEAVDQSKKDFLEAMKNRRQSDFWSNDEAKGSSEAAMVGQNGDVDNADEDHAVIGEDEDGEEEDVNDFRGPQASLAQAATISDLDYLKSKVKTSLSDSEDEDDEEEEEEGEDEKRDEEVLLAAGTRASLVDNEKPKISPEQEVKEEAEEEADVDDTGRLFVRNLPFSCSEEELRELFAPFGPVSELHLPLDAERKGKGFGFIQFMIPEHAATARSALDGTAFQGRLLHVIAAKQMVEKEAVDEDRNRGLGVMSSFQKKRDEARRKMAGRQEGWNASYVRADTVADSMSKRYNVEESQIMDVSQGGGELAVRLAIAEAHILQGNKEYLSSHGVDLTALESSGSSSRAAKRSTTTLLVKNLPPDSDQAELEAMFGKFGAMNFLMPPSKSVAIVDFVEPSHARNAFKTLAYRKYKHIPLYIEWAPVGVVGRSTEVRESGKPKVETCPGPETAVDDVGQFSSLFIKNLSFETSEDGLRTHIQSKLGSISSLRALSLPKKQKNGRVLSMGFGFVEFSSLKDATRALAVLQGSLLDGHSLEVKPSDKQISAASTKSSVVPGRSSGQTSTKLIVRNLAFQATQKELRDLFASFGSVKSVRIPKKMGGVHRGFAFVEMTTEQEAQAALSSLENAHFYGRHLVIEAAKAEDEGLDTLRKRASDDAAAIVSERKRIRLDTVLDERQSGLGGFEEE